MPITTRQRASRFLFQWEAADGLDYQGNLVARTGQIGTFSRGGTAGAATCVDTNGVGHAPGYQTPRFGYDKLSGTFGLLLEGAGTNLCIRSGDLSNAAWIKNGTTTATTGQADPFGGTSACTVACTVNGDNLYQAVTFTGNAVKTPSIFLKAGTAAVTDLAIYDVTAGAYVMQIRATWAAGVPTLSVIGGKGVAVAVPSRAGGFYRILCSSNAVTAANTNRFHLYPGGTAGQGTVIAVGAQAEDTTSPSSYIPTVAATVTRTAESLSFPVGFLPQAMTVYAKIVDLGTLSILQNTILAISGDNTAPRFYLDGAAGNKPEIAHNNGSAAVMSVPNQAVVFGDSLEVMGVLNADGSVIGSICDNGGATVVGAASAANALASAWHAQTLALNSLGAGAGIGSALFASVRIAAGAQSLVYMRAG